MTNYRTALALTTAALVALTGAPPAYAAAPALCVSGGVCLRNGGGYGTEVFFAWATGSTACRDEPTNDVIDWASKRSSRSLRVFENGGCSGASSVIYGGTHGSLGGWSDRINSVRWA